MLGRRLRQARVNLGLTQEALAEGDLTKEFVSLIERGLATPSLRILEMLAQRLGQPVSCLLEDREGIPADDAFWSLYHRGRSAHICGRYDDALRAFSVMRAQATARDDPDAVMRAALGAGEAFLELRRLAETWTHLESALGRARETKNQLVRCRALRGLATVELRNGNPSCATALYREALALVPNLKGLDATFHGEMWLYLSSALVRIGRLEESFEACVRARRILEDSVSPERLAEVYLNLGALSYMIGKYPDALSQYQMALASLEPGGNARILSHVHNNTGMALMAMGRYSEARGHLLVSLAIKKQVGDAAGECRTLTELARYFLVVGDIRKAREHAVQTVSLSRLSSVPDEEARARIVLAKIASREGHARRARRHLRVAAGQCERLSMTLELVAVYRELARIASRNGRYKEATKYQDRAFSALPTKAPQDIVGALHMSEIF